LQKIDICNLMEQKESLLSISQIQKRNKKEEYIKNDKMQIIDTQEHLKAIELIQKLAEEIRLQLIYSAGRPIPLNQLIVHLCNKTRGQITSKP